jgi:hypothetical protein
MIKPKYRVKKLSQHKCEIYEDTDTLYEHVATINCGTEHAPIIARKMAAADTLLVALENLINVLDELGEEKQLYIPEIENELKAGREAILLADGKL